MNENDAQRVARQWSNILGIPKDKNIRVLFGDKHRFATAQVCVFKDGKQIPDYAEEDAMALNDFDTIEITLFSLDEFKFQEWVKAQMFVSRILHELLHVRYPEWEENDIQDEEARLIGLLMKKLEPEEKKE